MLKKQTNHEKFRELVAAEKIDTKAVLALGRKMGRIFKIRENGELNRRALTDELDIIYLDARKMYAGPAAKRVKAKLVKATPMDAPIVPATMESINEATIKSAVKNLGIDQKKVLGVVIEILKLIKAA